MRRLVFGVMPAPGRVVMAVLGSVVMAPGLLLAGASAALAADPAPTISAPAVAGKKVCKITDPRLDELSGIVATATGFVVIDDSTAQESHKRIFFLDQKCKVVKEQRYSGAGPADPEDLILSSDGKTLWIADTGDDGVRATPPTHRPRVALWTMPADGSSRPKLHRLSYPDGDYHDAEALLLTGDSTPLIITKELGQSAGIYQPTGPLKTDNEIGVPMKRVGEIAVQATDTPGNIISRIGNRTIGGGAVALGGGKVVLRTYTDALEWDVAGGDVLAALQTKPRVTGLPNEQFGEAITYSPDGHSFYTVSDMNGDKAPTSILQYAPATTAAVAKKSGGSGSSSGGDHWYSNLTLPQITYLVGALGLVGLLLAGAGAVGITRSRRKIPVNAVAGPGADGQRFGEPATELVGIGGATQRAGATPGAWPAPGASGGVYGAAPGGTGPSAGLYGNAPTAPRGRSVSQPVGPQPPSRGMSQPSAWDGQQPPPRGMQAGNRSGGIYGAAAGQQGSTQGQPERGAPGRGQNAWPDHGSAGRGAAAPGTYGSPADGPVPPGRGGASGERPADGIYGGGRERGDGFADPGRWPENRFDDPGYGRG